MRSIVEVATDHANLIGTHHFPDPSSVGPAAPVSTGPAILLLNFGDLRRSGPGDLNARMADHLASLGYHAFRFDVPGLGDSRGNLPAFQETYWRFVEEGGQVPWTCELVSRLGERYGVSQFVLAGGCGGAVTAMLTALRCPSHLAGLILIEPVFDLTIPYGYDTMPGDSVTPWAFVSWYLHRRIETEKARLRDVDWIRPFVEFRRVCRAGRARPIIKPINKMLVTCWQKIQSMALPCLILLAPGAQRRFIRQTIHSHNGTNHVRFIDVDGTNHLFTAGSGQAVAIHESGRWLSERYPIGAPRDLASAGQPSGALSSLPSP